MNNDSLFRLAGLGLIGCAVLVSIGFGIHPHDPLGARHGPWIGAHLLILIGFLAGLFGLFGLYAAVARVAGLVGFAGFVAATTGTTLYLGKIYWSGFLYPLVFVHDAEFIATQGLEFGAQPVDLALAVLFIVGPVLFGVGFALLAWTVARSRILPASPAWLTAVGAALIAFWPLLPAPMQEWGIWASLVFVAGAAWLGGLMLADRAGSGRARRGIEPASPAVSTANAAHYAWGKQCDGWHLIRTPGLSVIQERVPPGASEVRHFHQRAEQFFFVLSGQARLEVNGELLELPEAHGCHVRPGQPHRLWNDGPDNLDFLVISAPPSHGDRVRAAG